MQIGILASGNYSYYNLLYIVLCLSLLDDHTFYRGKNRIILFVCYFIVNNEIIILLT